MKNGKKMGGSPRPKRAIGRCPSTRFLAQKVDTLLVLGIILKKKLHKTLFPSFFGINIVNITYLTKTIITRTIYMVTMSIQTPKITYFWEAIMVNTC